METLWDCKRSRPRRRRGGRLALQLPGDVSPGWSTPVRVASAGRRAGEGSAGWHRADALKQEQLSPPNKIWSKSAASEEEPGSWALGIPDCGFTRCSNQLASKLAQQMSEPAWPGSQSTGFTTATLARLLRCHRAGRVPVAGSRALQLMATGPRGGESSPWETSVSAEIDRVFMVVKRNGRE